MFSFYDINDLLLSYNMKSLKVASENGYEIVVSDLRLKSYGIPVQQKITSITNQGILKIIDQDETWMDFLEQHHTEYSYLGNNLLTLYHFCLTSNVVLVVDKSKRIVLQGAKRFGVTTTTIEEFYKDTVKEERHLNFIMELKQQEMAK